MCRGNRIGPEAPRPPRCPARPTGRTPAPAWPDFPRFTWPPVSIQTPEHRTAVAGRCPRGPRVARACRSSGPTRIAPLCGGCKIPVRENSGRRHRAATELTARGDDPAIAGGGHRLRRGGDHRPGCAVRLYSRYHPVPLLRIGGSQCGTLGMECRAGGDQECSSQVRAPPTNAGDGSRRPSPVPPQPRFSAGDAVGDVERRACTQRGAESRPPSGVWAAARRRRERRDKPVGVRTTAAAGPAPAGRPPGGGAGGGFRRAGPVTKGDPAVRAGRWTRGGARDHTGRLPALGRGRPPVPGRRLAGQPGQ